MTRMGCLCWADGEVKIQIEIIRITVQSWYSLGGEQVPGRHTMTSLSHFQISKRKLSEQQHRIGSVIANRNISIVDGRRTKVSHPPIL